MVKQTRRELDETPLGKPPKPKGPDPLRVKLEGNWADAVKAALSKKRPAGGWPVQPKKPQG